ncbi:MAG: two-component system activity regulator YycH [Thermoanaerobacteraceae bacterium]|nr:two-component system activity regulator YycH [Thermoanaerobacteraceae bacterium]
MMLMSERAKTILLVFLVALSIVLSFFMWYGVARPYVSSSAGGNQEISPAVLLNVLKPESIVINFGGMTHTPIMENSSFDSAWREFQNIVFLSSGNSTDVSESDFITAMDYRSIRYTFAFPIPVSYFNEAYGKQLDLPVNTIKDIIILSGSSPSFYIYDGFDSYVRMNLGYKNNGIETIISVNEDNAPLYSTAKDLGFTDSMRYDVLLPLDQELIKIPVISPGVLDDFEINALVSRFFESGSVVRRIKEISGDMVFTDGRRGLKIYRDGRLEYTYSTASSARVDDITAIKVATDFLVRYLPDINRVGLAGIKEEWDGYTINYVVRYNGLPVYSKQYGYPITVEVKNGQVSSLKAVSLGFSPKNTLTEIAVGALDAMDISFKEGFKYWTGLDICYVADDGRIRASWKVSDGDRTVYIDMENGSL